jgi:predicted RNA-binding protein with PUA-like domain
MNVFLVKTEPGEYSWHDLVKAGKATWDGVTNNTALLHMRRMAKGDDVLIYHTGDERAIVGLARVLAGPREDPANPGLNAAGLPKFAVVDLKPVKAAKTPLSLAQIKADARFSEFDLVKQSRLSVMPVPPAMDALIRAATGL